MDETSLNHFSSETGMEELLRTGMDELCPKKARVVPSADIFPRSPLGIYLTKNWWSDPLIHYIWWSDLLIPYI